MTLHAAFSFYIPTQALHASLESSISALKISISALEVSIKTLDGKSAFWERWLLPFSALVIVGVALEVWAILWDHRETLTSWRRGIVLPPERPSTGKLWLEIVATVLVVIGVAGEFGASGKIASINGQLRTRNSDLRSASDQLLALVTQEAGDANDRATTAQNRADAAENHAAEVQESVSPRRLTEKQASVIATRLLRFSGQPVVAISHTFDVESSVFAAEILSALHSGRWETDVPHFSISGNVSSIDKAPSIPGTGIFVSSSPEKGSELAAKAVLQVLSGEGFDCHVPKKSIVGFDPIRGLSERLVVIDVEARPQGPQGEAKLRAEGTKKQTNSMQPANQ